MKFIFLILINFGVLETFSQVDTNDILVIKEVLSSELNYQHSIAYTDRIENWIINFIKNELDNYIANGTKEYHYGPLLKMDDSEKDSLYSQIEELRYFVWRDSLINNSRVIVIDSSRAFFRNYYDSLPKNEKYNPNKIVIHCYKDTSLFSFSKPIYIRNQTICLIYFRKLNQIYKGNEELNFYKKERNIWYKWITLHSGTFE